MTGPSFKTIESANSTCNFSMFDDQSRAGHYESYFQRANHPEKPLAFWIRYTVFSPKGRPVDAIGELWVIYFDGEKELVSAVKQEFPISQTKFSRNAFDVTIGESILGGQNLAGRAIQESNEISWDLFWKGADNSIFFFPLNLYNKPLPKAKALVGAPNVRYSGVLVVNGQEIKIENWPGSQNHNWGSKHTDNYAWGQVAGFDNAPSSFLEVGTARIKLGPVWSPWMTPLVLRHNGREFSLNSIRQLWKNQGTYRFFDWTFSAASSDILVEGHIHAPKERFVALPYYNPPGGIKTCLNTKIASCELVVKYAGGKNETLQSENRAAFEILTDDVSHGFNYAV